MILMISSSGSSVISIDAHCRCGGAARGHGTSGTHVAEGRERVGQSRDGSDQW